MGSVASALSEQLASLVNALGYEFVGCEIHTQSGRSVLRIYIDHERGITLADCSKVSHQVSAMLDVEDPLPGHYTLEISSPGLNRPIFEIHQFQKYVGQQVKIRMGLPVNGRRNFSGMLTEVRNLNIHILMGTEEVVLPFSDIEKANLIAEA